MEEAFFARINFPPQIKPRQSAPSFPSVFGNTAVSSPLHTLLHILQNTQLQEKTYFPV